MFVLIKRLRFMLIFLWPFTPTYSGESCGPIHYTPGGPPHTLSLFHDEEFRSYLLYVPATYAGNAALIVDMHGQAASAWEERYESCWKHKADEVGAIVVYPQAKGFPPTWDAGDFCCSPRGHDDEGFIVSMVKCLKNSEKSNLSIDPNKIYAVGLSNGAAMAAKLNCDRSDIFAGASIASQSFPYVKGASCRRKTLSGIQKPAFPIIELRGLRDPLVPYSFSWLWVWSLPAEKSLAHWSNADNCSGNPEISDICDTAASGPDCQRGQGQCTTYSHCESGVAVSMCAVNGSHLLFQNRSDFNVCDASWNLFTQYPRLPE